MKESGFQFSNPVLTQLSFSINENFIPPEDGRLEIKIDNTLGYGEKNGNGCPISLKIHIGDETEESPFIIIVEMVSIFTWDEQIKEEQLEYLRTQNAPALLLGYIRPIVSNITNLSPYSVYNIPFINFTE